MSKKNWKKGRPTSSKEEVKYQLSFDPSRIDPRRLLQIMCKPPEWCKIEALHRRLYIWPEKIARRKKKPGGKNPRTAADGEHRQHGRHPEPI